MSGRIGTSTQFKYTGFRKPGRKFGSNCCNEQLKIMNGKYGQFLKCYKCQKTYKLIEIY